MKIFFLILMVVATASHVQAQSRDTVALAGDFLGSNCKSRNYNVIIITPPSTTVLLIDSSSYYYSVAVFDSDDRNRIKKEVRRKNGEVVLVEIEVIKRLKGKVCTYSVSQLSLNSFQHPLFGDEWRGRQLCAGEVPVASEQDRFVYTVFQKLCDCPWVSSGTAP